MIYSGSDIKLVGFSKGKSCLLKLIAFHDEPNTWLGEVRAVDVFHIDFGKALSTVSHNILTGKLRNCRLE